MTNNRRIYLASTSPRRQELLRQIDIDFSLLKVEVDEMRKPGESPATFVERLALDKARAGHALLDAGDTTPVLGADTVVVIDDTIMGKPRNREHGIVMLQSLSGRTHRVLTAVALVGDHEAVRLSSSSVTFATLDAAACDAYWDTGEPIDKAGSYAIQGRAAAFITRLDGSYSGVVGLPLCETVALLKEFGIKVL